MLVKGTIVVHPCVHGNVLEALTLVLTKPRYKYSDNTGNTWQLYFAQKP